MTFARRLQELCERGEHVDAMTLAKANLRHASDVSVAVDASSVVVETDAFRGVHPWSVDASGAPGIDQRGEYTCTLDGVDLALSTATMNERARDLALSELESRLGRPSAVVVEDGGRDGAAANGDGAVGNGDGAARNGASADADAASGGGGDDAATRLQSLVDRLRK